MPTITRTAPKDTVDADQLLVELNASASSTGSICSSVAVRPGSSEDTVEMIFDSDPSAAEVDGVIASHPVFTTGLVSQVELTSGSYTTVWSTLLAEGESAEVDANIILRLGDASNIEPVTIHFDGMGRRRTGSAVEVPGSGGDEVYGWIPQAGARLRATGPRLDLQVTARRSGTADVEGDVTIKRKVTP